MSRRGRALTFALLAILCAAGSAAIASRYTSGIDEQLGELRTVVAVGETIAGGRPLDRRAVARLEVREIPVRFAPIDALASPEEALGLRPSAPIPEGSYLLASQFGARAPKPRGGPKLGRGLTPIELEVASAGSLASPGTGADRRVDVVVVREPTVGRSGGISIAADRVRLLGLEQSESSDPASSAPVWIATLAVTRADALKLIEAENFAREVRLVPRG